MPLIDKASSNFRSIKLLQDGEKDTVNYKHGGIGDWHDVELSWVTEIPQYN